MLVFHYFPQQIRTEHLLCAGTVNKTSLPSRCTLSCATSSGMG